MSKILSASRLNDYLGCAHQAALWLAGVKPEGEADATLELIRAKGFDHEAVVLAHLEQKHGTATRIAEKESTSKRQLATLAAIKESAPLIYQGALTHERWLGYPDFLIRQNGDDGATRYLPEDAKLARKAKGQHLLQLGLYAELLEVLTNIPVGDGVIHVAAGDPQSFDLRRTRYILKRLMRVFEAFADDESRATRPIPCTACAQCDFKPRCEAEWRAADSPFFVAGMTGAQVITLEEAGIGTLAALAAHDPTKGVVGIGTDTLTRLVAQARLQLQARDSGEHKIEMLPMAAGRGYHLLPPSDPGDLFFDMEGDALFEEGLEYLFGIWGDLDGQGPRFHAEWAHSHIEEKAAFESVMRRFVDQLRRHPNAHIYHYAQYEPAAFRRLAMRYATMEAELDQMLRERRFVDLFRVARQSIRASTEGYSLKDLEKLYRGKREGAVTNAAASIVEYERWRVTGEQDVLDAIALYNKEDCVSTAEMRDWLEGMRPAGVVYGLPGDDAPEKVDRTAEREALEARKQGIAARVRSCAEGDTRVRDLVAELLWFHQRAQKPDWWAVFERQTWSEEELVEDAESLGGLVIDPNTPPVQVKQSMETTYTFPPQDTKLRVGGTPKIAATRANAGTIAELDPETGHAVLRRGIRSGPMPSNLSLISSPLDLQNIPDAVLAFAERFAAGGLTNDAALMDFLMRRPPRISGATSGTPIQADGETPANAALRAVLALDSSYLFIQGPPGTGKTYTAAEAIALLLKQGYRVGITSNSHKAINNLLEEVEKSVGAAKQSFSGAKKGSRDDPDTHFDSTHIKTVLTSDAITSAFSLVGGTVFHFCRDDQRGQFDYLIIDEAGQVALGNLVAMAGAARNLVLVGDQMQLPQPVQGVHPGETGLSSLEYLLEDKATVPPDRGVFLNESRRLHPDLCAFISEAIYDGRLQSHGLTAERYLVLQSGAHQALRPAGVTFFSVQHEGCTQSNSTEVDVIAALVDNLCSQHVQKRAGATVPMTLNDILIVAPYNMQVNLLKRRLPEGVRVGTVDKFQGQEAAVVIVSMTTSRGEDAPRGTEFLFNPNRFNVAVSRAQCLAIVVHGNELLDGAWHRIEDLRRLNLFAHADAIAHRVAI